MAVLSFGDVGRRRECGVFCEACGDCVRCYAEDWCHKSTDGKHQTPEGDE